MLRRLVLALLLAALLPATAGAVAPVLTVEGETLHWTTVTGTTEWQLAINPVSPEACQIEICFQAFYPGATLSATPEISDGWTEAYRVRRKKPTIGAWSNTVEITYPVPSGEVLWTADGQQSLVSEPEGTLYEWQTRGAQEAAQVKRVTNLDPADGGGEAPGGKAYRFETTTTGGEQRNEVRNGNPNGTPKVNPPQYTEGDTRGFAFQVYVPSSFPYNNSGFDLISQFHQQGGVASPPWQLDAQGGKFLINTDVMEHDEGGGVGPVPWEHAASSLTGKWVRFAFEAYFSVEHGWFDTYVDIGDGAGMVKRGERTFVPTVKWKAGTTTVLPTFSCLGSYRGNYAFSGPQHFYGTSYVIATDRPTAEAAAF